MLQCTELMLKAMEYGSVCQRTMYTIAFTNRAVMGRPNATDMVGRPVLHGAAWLSVMYH